MPSLTQVVDLKTDADGLTAERQAEYGYDTVKIPFPAVISVGDAINEPRYPSLKAIMGAKKKPLETVSAADAGIDTSKVGLDGSAVQCGDFKAPPQKAAGTIIDGPFDPAHERVVAAVDEAWLAQQAAVA